MGLKPLRETPPEGPYLKHDAVRFAEYFGVSFRTHGFSEMNSLAALRAFVVLDHDPIRLNRIMVQIPRLSMIFSENRYPLFGIML